MIRAWVAMVVGVAAMLVLAGCDRGGANGAQAQQGATPVARRVVGGLQEPVALVFLDRDTWLVAERRSGRIRVVENGALREAPFATLQVANPGGYHEYGLLGLAVHPQYPDPPYVYAFHTLPGAQSQRVVRFTVQDGRGVNPTPIIENLPAGTGCCHNGGRLLFGSDGMLYVTLGDTQRPELAQDYEALPGKVLRYTPDGRVAADNPLEQPVTAWSSSDEVAQLNSTRTPVFTLGHRNPFGLAESPEGVLYVSDNGPNGRDEINRLVGGDNYGWPQVMGRSDDAHYHNPVWTSGAATTAPTGMAFYTGDDLPQYRGNLFFANYKDGRLRRLVFTSPEQATAHVVEAAGANAKLEVAMGPDGYLYYTSLDAIYRLEAE